ncbi:hypothetical protein [Streptomyces cucumeris]|uniref:hypothetical protein n=1 Tax=Streptomyces cucumeris TaxID=2962890 RepID=UPI003D718B4A
MAPGKFDGLSRADLFNMIATAKPSQLTEVGAALGDVYTPLNELADELAAHAHRADWEGEGATAFKNWSAKLVKQTRLMADYTMFVGSNLSLAGQGLIETQKVIDTPGKLETKDLSPAQEKTEERDRQEALKAMDRLDSYYRTAHTDISALEAPNFPKLPPAASSVGDQQTPYGAEGGSDAATGRGGSSVSAKSVADAPHSSGGGHVTPIGQPDTNPAGDVGSVGGASAPPVTGTNIDSTTPAPPVDRVDRPSLPSTPPVGPEQRNPGPGPFPTPGPLLPATGRTLPPGRTVPPGRTAPPGTNRIPNVPPTLRGGPPTPPIRGPIGTPPGPTTGGRPIIPPRGGPRDGITGLSRPNPKGPVPRLPQNPVVGQERPLMGRNMMGGGYHPVNTNPTTPGTTPPGRRLASERGGIVDRPNGKGQANGQRLPRTTVVGEERGMVRGPMGAGAHPVTGAPQGPGGSGARRVSSEPGGVTGSPRASGKGRAEFTPGGSGLVRNAQTPGMIPPRTGAARPGDRQDQNGTRPDYLQEDEETWTGGRRDTVPPVID